MCGFRVFTGECVGFVYLLVSVWGFENGLRIVFCHFFQLFHEINCVCLTFYCLVVTKKLYVLCIQKIISLSESIFDRDVEPLSHWAFSMMNLHVGIFQGFSLDIRLNNKVSGSKRILDRAFIYIWLHAFVQGKFKFKFQLMIGY